MPQDQVLLTILGGAILLNVLLVAASWVRSRGHRPSLRLEPVVASMNRIDRRADGSVAAAVEAFVAGVSADAAGATRLPTPAEVLARRREAVEGRPAAVPAVRPRSTSAEPEEANRRVPARVAELADSATWERLVREESARAARSGRPSTVVTASLPHLEDIAERWGRNAADRVVAETVRLLESEGRAVDRIARLGDARFGILMPETGELGASRYVERVRALADAWLISAGLSVRLEFGWTDILNGSELGSRGRVPAAE